MTTAPSWRSVPSGKAALDWCTCTRVEVARARWLPLQVLLEALAASSSAPLWLSTTGSTLAIGAPNGNAAYVFACTPSTGNCGTAFKLIAPNGGGFGFAVAVTTSGTTAYVAVGASYVSSRGYAYIYACVAGTGTCTLQQNIQPSGLPINAYFGSGVAWSTDATTLVIACSSTSVRRYK